MLLSPRLRRQVCCADAYGGPGGLLSQSRKNSAFWAYAAAESHGGGSQLVDGFRRGSPAGRSEAALPDDRRRLQPRVSGD